MKALGKSLRLAAGFEGVTLIILLCVAVPLKYGWGNPTLVRGLGPIHGVAFLTYIYQVLKASARQKLSLKPTLTLVAAGFVPGGTFVALRRL